MKQGWKIQTLGDVATFINGDRSTNYPSKKDYVIDGIPFVNAGNLIQSGIDLESLNLISQSKYDSLTQGKFVEGDILFCLRGTLGKHSIVQNGLNGAIASSLVIIRAKDGFNNKYISYFLDYKQPFIERLNNGAAQPNIPAKTMKGFPILLPPNEKQQQSIVDYLDSAFAQIDELKSNAERQLAEARALFQSALTQAMQPKPGWQSYSLKDICQIKSVLIDPTEGKYRHLIHVGGANIVSGSGSLIDLKTATEEGVTSGKFTFDENDVLYNKIRPYLIKVARPGFKGICSADMYPITPKEKLVKDYLYYILISPEFTKYAILNSGRAGMPKINRDALFSYNCSIPSIEEQQHFSNYLDSLSLHVRELEEISRKTATECDALKQALLRQIFE